MTSTGLPAEAELLLACARTTLDTAARERILALAAMPIDWARLHLLAEQHRVAPLVYRSLSRVGAPAIPAGALAGLRAACQQYARANLLLTREIIQMTRALLDHGIPAIALKGPILAAQVYGDVAARQFDDLDILIHRADFERAEQVLLEHGYRPAEAHTPAEAQEYIAQHNDYAFVQPARGVRLELQWRITERPVAFPRRPERLWAGLVELKLAGATLDILPPDSLLLLLCVHGAKHGWERLQWLCDVAELLRGNPPIDWPGLFARARAEHCRRMLLLGLLLAHELLGAPLPGAARPYIAADQKLAALTAQARANMFEGRAAQAGLVEYPLFYLDAFERVYDRARVVFYCFPNLWHPLRLIQKYQFDFGLLGRHGLGACKRFLGL